MFGDQRGIVEVFDEEDVHGDDLVVVDRPASLLFGCRCWHRIEGRKELGGKREE